MNRQQALLQYLYALANPNYISDCYRSQMLGQPNGPRGFATSNKNQLGGNATSIN